MYSLLKQKWIFMKVTEIMLMRVYFVTYRAGGARLENDILFQTHPAGLEVVS